MHTNLLFRPGTIIFCVKKRPFSKRQSGLVFSVQRLWAKEGGWRPGLTGNALPVRLNDFECLAGRSCCFISGTPDPPFDIWLIMEPSRAPGIFPSARAAMWENCRCVACIPGCYIYMRNWLVHLTGLYCNQTSVVRLCWYAWWIWVPGHLHQNKQRS